MTAARGGRTPGPGPLVLRDHPFDGARARRACADAACGRLPGRSTSAYARRVSLTQLGYFVAVAEEQHVGRAARRLHVSQPPLSRQIRSLEDELGAPLFARTPRGVRLLPAGERFLDHARAILAAVDAARHAVHDPPAIVPPDPKDRRGP